MCPDKKKLIMLLAEFAEKENLQVTVKQSAKGALICGTCTLFFGLCAGPIGLAIGGAVGGYAAYRTTQGSFRSVSHILRSDFNDDHHDKLIEYLLKALKISDIKVLLNIIVMMHPKAAMALQISELVLKFLQYGLETYNAKSYNVNKQLSY